jgi:hypothetical protein
MGIADKMITAVYERTREIGILKVLDAPGEIRQHVPNAWPH